MPTELKPTRGLLKRMDVTGVFTESWPFSEVKKKKSKRRVCFSQSSPRKAEDAWQPQNDDLLEKKNQKQEGR